MGTRELSAMVEMFYFLIRVDVARVYPFIKTPTICLKQLSLTVNNSVKFIPKINFSLCTKFEIKTQSAVCFLSRGDPVGRMRGGRPSAEPVDVSPSQSRW